MVLKTTFDESLITLMPYFFDLSLGTFPEGMKIFGESIQLS